MANETSNEDYNGTSIEDYNGTSIEADYLSNSNASTNETFPDSDNLETNDTDVVEPTLDPGILSTILGEADNETITETETDNMTSSVSVNDENSSSDLAKPLLTVFWAFVPVLAI